MRILIHKTGSCGPTEAMRNAILYSGDLGDLTAEGVKTLGRQAIGQSLKIVIARMNAKVAEIAAAEASINRIAQGNH